MSLKDVYQRFLSDPRSAPLAPDVSLIYITSTTEFNGAEAVLKHLTKQQHIIKTNSQTVIDAVQGSNALSLDIETALQFVSGGGAYLPNLDETFLLDRVAKFPTIHIVRFNSQNQIQSVRVYWDQASLLKQVEVIGNRSRSWPVRDADKQTRLIRLASNSAPADNGAPQVKPSSTANKDDVPQAPPSPGKKHIKDPYAADSLFDLISPSKDGAEPVRLPRAPASAKPPPREYNELFVGDEENDAPDATPSRSRTVAPKAGAGKNYRPSRIFDADEVEDLKEATPVAPKAGAGKNYRPSRIFDDDETAAHETHEQIAYRANTKRFDHFELGGDNSSREIKPTASRPGSRHVNHWDFQDFETPEKPRRKPRGQEVRHFGWSDDEPDQDSPPARPRVVQPRRDAETHFQLTDAEEEQNGARIIRSYQNKGLGLYKDTLYAEADEGVAEESARPNSAEERPLSVVHNGPNRQKDFASHWDVTDEEQPANGNVNHENKKPLATTDRLKAVKMLESSWDTYDEASKHCKATPPPHRRALRNVNQRSWEFDQE
ncbi:hypothetical protein BJX68DRAFT_15878 [Aspergillus pseudodeflectus]|uniref:Uncharacterized protein n=1 Tax=Aspergillus pseudodeflectus TaxID=176178 RepID=A0ABR4LBY3_9EURO